MLHEATPGHTKREARSRPFVSFRGPFPSSARLASAFLLLVACAQLSLAMPLDEYRERVVSAATTLSLLVERDEDESEQSYAERRAETLQGVRLDIPLHETVEFKNMTFRVDNTWFHQALNDYEKQWAVEPDRTDMLTRITERLHALDERLKEIEAGKLETAAEGKEADRKRLGAILQREEYQKKQAEKGLIARYWERFVEWLRSLFPETRPLEQGESRMFTRLAQIIVVALALAVIAYAAWKFAPRLMRRSGKRKGGEKRGARVVLGETLAADQTAADLLAEAEALARAGNLRAAIRKGYIALLCELGDRKVLSLAQHKTNRDYLRAVADRGALHQEMQQLTHSFENHWYGFVTATPDDWASFRARYYEALRQ